MTLQPGDPAPWFRTAGTSNPAFAFDTVAGRWAVLAVTTADGLPAAEAAIAALGPARARFDDLEASFFVVAADTPEARARAADDLPGVRWLFDDGSVAKAYGAAERPLWFLLDPMLRVFGVSDDGPRLLAQLDRLPPADRHGSAPGFAPVLVLPRVFEPGFCEALIEHYEAQGGEPSGFMREVDGVTRVMMDPRHKRRMDVHLEDETLRTQARARIIRRLIPQIERAFQFRATRMERYLVACYDAESGGGWFRAHRDNTTKGTAHRRFAVSINLNADFEGGELRFPEFGARTYRPPVGGAVVFSCSLLHEATPVTAGRRFAFLPFLYDEDGARIRERNLRYVDPAAGGAWVGDAEVEPAPAEAPDARAGAGA